MRKVGVTQQLTERRRRSKLCCLLFPCIWWVSRVRLFHWFKAQWLHIQCLVLIKNIIGSTVYNKCSANGPGKEERSAFFRNVVFFFITWNQMMSFCHVLQEIFNFLLHHFTDFCSFCHIQATFLIFFPQNHLIDVILFNEHYKNKNKFKEPSCKLPTIYSNIWITSGICMTLLIENTAHWKTFSRIIKVPMFVS